MLTGFQIKQLHLLLQLLAFLFRQPVAVNRAGALSGVFDFLRAAMTCQPVHKFIVAGCGAKFGLSSVSVTRISLPSTQPPTRNIVWSKSRAIPLRDSTLPVPRQFDRRRERKDLVLLRAPAAFLEIAVGRCRCRAGTSAFGHEELRSSRRTGGRTDACNGSALEGGASGPPVVPAVIVEQLVDAASASRMVNSRPCST